MLAQAKPLANAFAIAMALFLLGVLLLVSSGSGDGAQRNLEQHLVALQEVGASMQSEAIAADGLQIDVRERFQSLEKDTATSQAKVRDLTAQLFASETSFTDNVRALALAIFNVVDTSERTRASNEQIRGRIETALTEADRLLAATNRFTTTHSRYLNGREELAEAGRVVVSELRSQNHEAAADLVFAGVQQALERLRRVEAQDTTPVDNVVRRIREVALPDERMRPRVYALSVQLAELLPKRLELNGLLDEIASNQFPRMADQARELLLKNYLMALEDTGDARVLLNVYTLLMLINLVLFGWGLARSHAALNRSHGLLEERVRERTRDLEFAYEDLKESQVQLVQAEKMSSLGQLVAGVVHEINTPLLYVLNNTQMTHELIAELDRSVGAVKQLSDRVSEGPVPQNQLQALIDQLKHNADLSELQESIEEVLTLTSDSTEGLNDIDELVKSLKDFSRLDRAAYDHFDLRDGLEKTLLITKNLLKYGIDVEKHFEEVPEILCAPSRVNQVFINLITNAAQAMGGKGVLKLFVGVDDKGLVFVRIEDTGCGIAQEHLDKVLDPFFTTKPVGEGTGLGLSIVRKIMEEHGGALEIESAVNEGTQITLRFPMEAPQTDSEQEAAA